MKVRLLNAGDVDSELGVWTEGQSLRAALMTCVGAEREVAANHRERRYSSAPSAPYEVLGFGYVAHDPSLTRSIMQIVAKLRSSSARAHV